MYLVDDFKVFDFGGAGVGYCDALGKEVCGSPAEETT